MAIKEIAPVKMELNQMSGAIELSAATAAEDGFRIPYAAMDTKIVLIVQNGGSAEATLTIRKGNSLQGVADSEAFAIGAAKTTAIVLESGKYKNVSGENKGAVIAVPSALDVKLAAVVLP